MNEGTEDDEPEESDKLRLYNITDEQYIVNLVMMSGLFIIFSFDFWLINFQQEYLGNDIYLNFYVTGFVLIVSGQLVMFLFKPLGLRLMIQVSTSMMMVAAIFIILLQQRWLSFSDSDEEVELLNYCIPLTLLILSLSCQMGFCSIGQTVFQDERIFPFERKATAINIIIFISKIFTIGASFVNELNEPLPIVFIIVLAFLGLLLINFFPTR